VRAHNAFAIRLELVRADRRVGHDYHVVPVGGVVLAGEFIGNEDVIIDFPVVAAPDLLLVRLVRKAGVEDL